MIAHHHKHRHDDPFRGVWKCSVEYPSCFWRSGVRCSSVREASTSNAAWLSKGNRCHTGWDFIINLVRHATRHSPIRGVTAHKLSNLANEVPNTARHASLLIAKVKSVMNSRAASIKGHDASYLAVWKEGIVAILVSSDFLTDCGSQTYQRNNRAAKFRSQCLNIVSTNEFIAGEETGSRTLGL